MPGRAGEVTVFTHLLVALDGSPRSEAVIPHAIDVARSMGARITLLRVVERVGADWGERGAMGKSLGGSLPRSPFAAQAEAYLAEVAARFSREGVRAAALARQGLPAAEIVAAATDVFADAIAMTACSRRGLNRLMFGSVEAQVLHGASVPVLLVRAG